MAATTETRAGNLAKRTQALDADLSAGVLHAIAETDPDDDYVVDVWKPALLVAEEIQRKRRAELAMRAERCDPR